MIFPPMPAPYGPKSNLTATTTPGPTDDASQGYSQGSMWHNNSALGGTEVWVCQAATAGAAVWRRQSPALIGPIVRPGLNVAFDTYFPYAIRREVGGRIVTDFDPVAWAPNPALYTDNIFYVNAAKSDDSGDGLTWAAAKKSIHAAVTLGNATAAPFQVRVAAGIYYRGNSLCGAAGNVFATQHVAFVAYGGRVVNVIGDSHSWTVHSGATYKVTRSNAIRCVSIDASSLDAWGDYTETTAAADLAACVATAGTWYTDNVTVYVHRADEAAVTSANTRVYLGSSTGTVKGSTSGNTYFEGFDFEGGQAGSFDLRDNASGRFVFKTCSFKWPSSPSRDQNCVSILDVDGAAFVNCVAARGQKDGFNAHTRNAKNPFVITLNCEGRNNGSTAVNSCNGLTTHDGIYGVDIGGVYHGNYGGQCAHVNAGTQHWYVGTACHDSNGDSVTDPTDWLADQGATTLWLDNCTSIGSTYAAQALGGSAISYRNCDFRGDLVGVTEAAATGAW